MEFATPERIEQIREQLSEENPEAVLFDDCDRALIGGGRQWGSPPLAVYSYTLLIKVFMDLFAQDYEDEEEYDPYTAACEWVGHNVECMYVGEGTPIIVQDWGLEDI